MNIFTCIKIIVAVTMFMSISGIVQAGVKDTFLDRIQTQSKAVVAARDAKEINSGELTTLQNAISKIESLYKDYSKDNIISPAEAKDLKSMLDDSDVNIFRKRYTEKDKQKKINR